MVEHVEAVITMDNVITMLSITILGVSIIELDYRTTAKSKLDLRG